jgi:hypothetical protein
MKRLTVILGSLSLLACTGCGLAESIGEYVILQQLPGVIAAVLAMVGSA